MYATWFADVKQQQGAYLDSWIQYGWYNNDVSGEGAGTDSYHSDLGQRRWKQGIA
ncbi:Outer membrane protein IcsA autotransporter precursor [Budvicia aquatica]|uniref:Outer membrane protein IcsA autotransporter n=1 Tax=Budvicia aquatica TaxID=82979 RepID=A0A484ZQ70_9GAMM|nr:Outer membrane protein IcsA autotransporter precursor [Budvicia aquatica]